MPNKQDELEVLSFVDAVGIPELKVTYQQFIETACCNANPQDVGICARLRSTGNVPVDIELGRCCRKDGRPVCPRFQYLMLVAYVCWCVREGVVPNSAPDTLMRAKLERNFKLEISPVLRELISQLHTGMFRDYCKIPQHFLRVLREQYYR